MATQDPGGFHLVSPWLPWLPSSLHRRLLSSGFLLAQLFLGGWLCSTTAISAAGAGTAATVAAGGAFRWSSSTRLASSLTGEVSSASWLLDPV